MSLHLEHGLILGLTNWPPQVNFNFLFPKFTVDIEIKPFPNESESLNLYSQNWWSKGLKSACFSKCQALVSSSFL